MHRFFKPLLPNNLRFGQISIASIPTYHTDTELLVIKKNLQDENLVRQLQAEYEINPSLNSKLALENAQQQYQNSFDTLKSILQLEKNTPRPK